MRLNREILASITFGQGFDHVSDYDRDYTSDADFNADFGPGVFMPPQDETDNTQNAATTRVIQCLKLALGRGITSISQPERQRPLNPEKDFTIETTMTFTSPSFGIGCCGNGATSVKQHRRGASQHPVLRRVETEEAGASQGIRVVNQISGYADELEHDRKKSHRRLQDSYDTDTYDNHPSASDEEDDYVDDDMPFVKFKFTDYSPMCYRHIREFFHVDPKAYCDVLQRSRWHSIPTPGKSAAQLFFCGRDWVIKTMTNEESAFLRKILHRYYYHVRDNPHTLLPHFVGHHRLEVGGEKLHVIIMQNVFATTNTIHEKYDLKGSTIGRYASDAEKLRATCTQKDLDLNKPVHVGAQRRRLLIEQIKKDCDFLKRSSVMDYSFLVGIHILPRHARPPPSTLPVATSMGHTFAQTIADQGGSRFATACEIDGTRAGCNPSATSHAADADRPADSFFSERTSMMMDGRCFTSDHGGMCSNEVSGLRREIYYIGIIDILQEYNSRKRLEHATFGIVLDRSCISCVDPNTYAARFISFMSSIIV